jgi:hypothetical protein
VFRLSRVARRLSFQASCGPDDHDVLRPAGVRVFTMYWNDYLAPPLASRHGEQEVRGWFADTGFEYVELVDEPKMGARGRRPAVAASTHCRRTPPSR